MTTEAPSAVRVSLVRSLLIFVIAVGAMGYFRLHVYSTQVVVLTYALPLLVCLWYRDARLLWAMTAAFCAMSAFKTFWLLPVPDLSHLVMQLANILIVAATVHMVLIREERLRQKRVALQKANAELEARQEQITRQNEELQAQAEELAQQNEELQQQGEELQQQNEELQRQAEELELQSEELQAQTEESLQATQELQQREAMLQTLLTSLRDVSDEHHLAERICATLVNLIGEPAAAAAVFEINGDELILRTQAGSEPLPGERWPLRGSFASIVISHGRTAYVDDLLSRPDLNVAQPRGGQFRSVLATPLQLRGQTIGAVKVYSREPRSWTTEHFRLVEWVAAQCSLAFDILRLREDLERANARLEEQVRDRTARLQEMVNELEYFSYTITHDMRAPLRAMQGFAGILEELCRANVTPEMQDCLARIKTAASRMDGLITDALSYSKTVKEELEVTPVNLGPLVRGIVESYPSFQTPQARIEIAPDLPVVLGNEAALTQCFSNLLGNAVKFVQSGQIPEVRVYSENNGDSARIYVEDRGIGIPREMLPRMFQMFQRASKAYEGTGIGLALVRKVTERMGGRVGVNSELGTGSRFWIELKTADGATSIEPASRVTVAS